MQLIMRLENEQNFSAKLLHLFPYSPLGENTSCGEGRILQRCVPVANPGTHNKPGLEAMVSGARPLWLILHIEL